MISLYRRLAGLAIPGALLGAVILAGAPGYTEAAETDPLPPQIAANLETILQTRDDMNFLDELQALIEGNTELAARIAGAATEARPGLAVDIFLAAAEVAPEEAGDIADAVANAAPDLADAVYAELSNVQTAGGQNPVPPPHVRKILKGTLENPNVVSPSG